MRQFAAGLLTTLAISGLVGFGFAKVQASDTSATVLTESQIESIKDRCLASKVALNKLHSTDALLRVNLGQKYENISSRLMAPLNSRVALNSYDSLDLVETTVDFNRALDVFRSQYRTYELSVDRAIDIDCQQNPVEYYAAIGLFRQQRADLHTATNEVNRLTQQYLDRFDSFAAQVVEEQAK